MSEEKQIFDCHTALALSDEFFCDKQHASKEDLFPVLHSLVKECEGKIKESGIYAFKLQIVKLK